MVAVSEPDHIVQRLVVQARALVPGRDVGPVITRQAKERIERAITEAEQAGAKVLVDGRNAVVPGREARRRERVPADAERRELAPDGLHRIGEERLDPHAAIVDAGGRVGTACMGGTG
jgi:hypothetical protein